MAKAFQPLQNGVALVLPFVLYKLLAKACDITHHFKDFPS
jgi:hypothetical protein